MTDKSLYIEEKIIDSVKTLLTGRVNELLAEAEDMIPPIEFTLALTGGYSVVPVIRLVSGERNEKDRIIKADVYVLNIIFTVPEGPDGERNCYAYAALLEQALGEDTTLGGAVERAVLIKKSYTPPNTPLCGDTWEAVFTLHLTVEGMYL
jgi:hypothetical protein